MTAEIRFGIDRSTIAKIGNRSVYQYWQLLAREFQGILLAPQRRPDEGGVGWNWREPAGEKPLTASELAGVRERLANANRSFAENTDASELGSENLGGLSAEDGAEQLLSKVNEVVSKLIGKTDAKLAAYVCRTETGVMIHSWGASVPAQVRYPDAHDCEVSGIVLVGEKGAADFEVVLESRTGVRLARTRSDASGAFRLQKIGPGTHRVRVVSNRVDFPVSGVPVTVEQTSITNLELRSTSLVIATGVAAATGAPSPSGRTIGAAEDAEKAEAVASRAKPRRRMLRASVIAAVAISVAGGVWWTWRWWQAGDVNVGSASAGSSLTSGQFSGTIGKNVPVSSSRLANTGRIGARSETPMRRMPSKAGQDRAEPAASAPASQAAMSADTAGQDGENGSAPELGNKPNRAPPEPGERNPAEPRDTPEKSGAVNNAADRGDLAPEATDKTKPLDPEEPSDATRPSADRNPPKPSRPAEAKTESAAAKQGFSAPDATSPADRGEKEPDAKLTESHRAEPKVAPTGAKSGRVQAETEKDSSRLPTANSEDTDDVGGSQGASSSAQERPAVHLADRTQVAGGRAGRTMAAPAPNLGQASEPKGESPDQTSASDARAVVSMPFAEIKTEKPAAQAHPVQAQGPSVTESAAQAGTSDSDAASAVQATPSEQNSAASATTLRASPSKRSPAEQAKNPGDVVSAGAVAPAIPPPVENQERAAPPPAAAQPHVGHSPRGNRPGATASPDQDSSAAESTTSKTSVSPAEQNAGDPDDGERLVRELHVRVSSWRPQLVHDVILPTEPVLAGQDDAIGSLRERYFIERKNQMPETFKKPVLWSGYVLEVTASAAGTGERLYWRTAAGSVPNGASVNGARAEITWSGGTPPEQAEYTLCRAGDRPVATISVRQGEVALKAAARVRCWYWMAVEPSPADSAGLPPERAAARFSWQLRRGPAMSEPVSRDEHWSGGGAQRADLPLDLRDDAGERSDSLVFVDRITGWAIGSEIRQSRGPSPNSR